MLIITLHQQLRHVPAVYDDVHSWPSWPSANITAFHGFKHMVVPIFGLLANLGCMLFYLIGPFNVAGMSPKEPLIALGMAVLWMIIGGAYFMVSSKSKGKEVILTSKPQTA